MRTVLRRPRKRLRFPVLPLFFMAVAIVLIIMLLTGVFSKSENLHFSRSSYKLMPFSKEDVFMPFAGGIAYVDAQAGRLKYIDTKAKVQWGLENATKDMTLYASTERLGVVVSKKLQVLNIEGKIIFSKSFDRPIERLSISNNITVVRLTAPDKSNTLIVLGKYDEELDKITELTGQTIIDFGTFSEGTGVWYLTVDRTSTLPVYRYYTSKYIPSKKSTAGYHTSDEMLYKPVFSDKGTYLCGTVNALLINEKGEVIKRTAVSGFEEVSEGVVKSQTHLLFRRLPSQGSSENKEFMAVSPLGTANFVLPENAISIFSGQNSYYAFSTHNLYKINPDNLKKALYTLPFQADSVIKDDKNGALITSGEQVYYLHLPK